MFPYFGRKMKIHGRYAPPLHEHIVEPFAGSASYALLHHAKHVTICEKNQMIAQVWRFLIEKLSEKHIAKWPDELKKGQDLRELKISVEERRYIGFWAQPGSSRPGYTVTEFGEKQWSRAKQFIRGHLPIIRKWTLIEGDYSLAPDVEATWFIDPPYYVAGGTYLTFLEPEEYKALGKWCLKRRGQLIVCEGAGADWLPFKKLCDFTSFEGRKSIELVYTRNS